MTQRKYVLLIFILGGLYALAPISIDMYLPGFPAIAKDLHTTTERVSLSLSGFFIGIGLGQLLYGPLLDRFGRKKPLYFGLVVYIFASISCMYARSIDMLIILRLVQAIGCCAAGVASVAMVRDLFPVEDSAKVFALLMLVLGVSPMLAPTAGGLITAAFGWQAVFLVLAGIAVLVLIAILFVLPESYQPDPTISLHPKPILSNFFLVLSHPQFYTYSFTSALAFAGLFAYVAASPLIFIEILGVSGKVYGWIFAFLSIGFIGSSQVNTMLLKKHSSERIIVYALIFQLAVSVAFLLGELNGWFNLYGTIGIIFLFLCGLGFANPNAAALTLAPFSKNAGSASALMGATQMGLGALASISISVFSNHTGVPLALILCSTSLLALAMLFTGRRNIVAPVAADALAAGSLSH